MAEVWRHRVETATVKVRLTDDCGQGVVVAGGFVLTAAHCVEWTNEGAMAFGDPQFAIVEAAGRRFRLVVVALEPCSDIAVLGAPDNPAMFEEAKCWDEFCKTITPVSIDESEPPIFENFPVHVRTHLETWETCTAMLCRESAQVLAILTIGKQIQGGTSGGPIVNDHGMLVGIVSNAAEVDDGKEYPAHAPRPHLALPRWIFEVISRAQIAP